MTHGVDMSKTIISRSDQLNSDDLQAGPLTGKIMRVFSTGSAEQPIGVDLDSWPQPWKPSKSMRRALVSCWGIDGDSYVGRSVRLFRNPAITFGGISVGGVEISHVSHIDKPMSIMLTVSKGKKKPFVIDVLRDAPAAKPQPVADTPPSTDAKLLAEFADLCAALTNAKTQPEYDTCLAECTRLKPSLDKKSLTTLTGLVNAAKARLPQPQSTFDVFRDRINATDVNVPLMNAIMDDVAKAVGEKRLTEAESVELNRIVDERMAVL